MSVGHRVGGKAREAATLKKEHDRKEKMLAVWREIDAKNERKWQDELKRASELLRPAREAAGGLVREHEVIVDDLYVPSIDIDFFKKPLDAPRDEPISETESEPETRRPSRGPVHRLPKGNLMSLVNVLVDHPEVYGAAQGDEIVVKPQSISPEVMKGVLNLAKICEGEPRFVFGIWTVLIQGTDNGDVAVAIKTGAPVAKSIRRMVKRRSGMRVESRKEIASSAVGGTSGGAA